MGAEVWDEERKVVLTYPTGKQLTAQGQASPWLGF